MRASINLSVVALLLVALAGGTASVAQSPVPTLTVGPREATLGQQPSEGEILTGEACGEATHKAVMADMASGPATIFVLDDLSDTWNGNYFTEDGRKRTAVKRWQRIGEVSGLQGYVGTPASYPEAGIIGLVDTDGKVRGMGLEVKSKTEWPATMGAFLEWWAYMWSGDPGEQVLNSLGLFLPVVDMDQMKGVNACTQRNGAYYRLVQVPGAKKRRATYLITRLPRVDDTPVATPCGDQVAELMPSDAGTGVTISVMVASMTRTMAAHAGEDIWKDLQLPTEWYPVGIGGGTGAEIYDLVVGAHGALSYGSLGGEHSYAFDMDAGRRVLPQIEVTADEETQEIRTLSVAFAPTIESSSGGDINTLLSGESAPPGTNATEAQQRERTQQALILMDALVTAFAGDEAPTVAADLELTGTITGPDGFVGIDNCADVGRLSYRLVAGPDLSLDGIVHPEVVFTVTSAADDTLPQAGGSPLPSASDG